MGTLIFWLVILAVLVVLFVRLLHRSSARFDGDPAHRTAVFPPGDSPTYRPGDSPTYRPGDSATYAPGDSATYAPGDSATYAPGDSATYAPGDSATYAPGDSTQYAPQNAAVYAPGDSATYAPARPIGSRPRPGPPAASPSPPTPRRRRSAPGTRPAPEKLAVVVETDPLPRTQAGFGSTALGNAAQDSTLFLPYHPSALMTGLSSSLTTSLSTTLSDARITGAAPDGQRPRGVLDEFQPVPLSPAVEAQVAELLSQGYAVEAVRVVSGAANVSLLEAMATVESLRPL